MLICSTLLNLWLLIVRVNAMTANGKRTKCDLCSWSGWKPNSTTGWQDIDLRRQTGSSQDSSPGDGNVTSWQWGESHDDGHDVWCQGAVQSAVSMLRCCLSLWYSVRWSKGRMLVAWSIIQWEKSPLPRHQLLPAGCYSTAGSGILSFVLSSAMPNSFCSF